MVFFLDIPTEILSRILFCLSAVDLCIAQRICRHINKIITDTASLQYIIRAHINSVHDILPPDCSFHHRLGLLKQYEKSWNNLQLDKSAELPINTEAPISKRYTLQNGYLIYETSQRKRLGPTCKYGYLDLHAATRNKEASWVRIQIHEPDYIKCHLPPSTSVVNNGLDRDPDSDTDSDPLYAPALELGLIFSVDRDLVVSIRFCILPSHLLSAMPDKATVYCRCSSHLEVIGLCLLSLSLLLEHPIPLPRSISCGFPRANLSIFPL